MVYSPRKCGTRRACRDMLFNELREDSVLRKFRITAADGKNYNTQFHNPGAMILPKTAQGENPDSDG